MRGPQKLTPLSSTQAVAHKCVLIFLRYILHIAEKLCTFGLNTLEQIPTSVFNGTLLKLVVVNGRALWGTTSRRTTFNLVIFVVALGTVMYQRDFLHTTFNLLSETDK